MKRIAQLIALSILITITACHSRKKASSEQMENESFLPEMVSFQPYEGNPVFSGTGTDTWDKKIRERGYILFEDGLYKMWYTGYNPESDKVKHLGYATSKDGIHWTRFSDKPIFSDKWTEDVFVLKNAGTYYMFAEGDNDVAHLLISTDGIHWKEQGDLVILTTRGDTIHGPYGTPAVWIENDKWYLFYERNDSAIWIAETNDKITWKNIQDDPVLKPGPDNFDIAAIAVNQIVKFNDCYFMYYHATSNLDWQHPVLPVVWTSNVAKSTDLFHWVKYSGNPVVEGDHSSPILVFDGNKPSLYTMHSEVCRYSSQ